MRQFGSAARSQTSRLSTGLNFTALGYAVHDFCVRQGVHIHEREAVATDPRKDARDAAAVPLHKLEGFGVSLPDPVLGWQDFKSLHPRVLRDRLRVRAVRILLLHDDDVQCFLLDTWMTLADLLQRFTAEHSCAGHAVDDIDDLRRSACFTQYKTFLVGHGLVPFDAPEWAVVETGARVPFQSATALESHLGQMHCEVARRAETQVDDYPSSTPGLKLDSLEFAVASPVKGKAGFGRLQPGLTSECAQRACTHDQKAHEKPAEWRKPAVRKRHAHWTECPLPQARLLTALRVMLLDFLRKDKW